MRKIHRMLGAILLGLMGFASIAQASSNDLGHAKIKIITAHHIISRLNYSQFTNHGNRWVLQNRLQKSIKNLHNAHATTNPDKAAKRIARAVRKLNRVILRSDGCINWDSPDTKTNRQERENPKKDWIINCHAQRKVYALLQAAIDVLTVDDVNNAPEATAQSITTNEELVTNITLAGSDSDGSISTYTVVLPPSNGTLTGTAPNLIYTPTANYSGDDSFTFTVTDDDSATSTEATVSININNLPEHVQNVQAVAADSQVTLSWDTATDGTSYDVCYATETISSPANCATHAGGTSLLDQSSPVTIAGLTNRTRYFFVIIPKIGEVEADPSELVSANYGYTKLDSNGAVLADNASNWSCVQDDITGQIWEVKTDDDGLRDKDKRYTWYDPNPLTNGGDEGTESGENDTDSFVAAVNTASLCGATNWRMPTIDELKTLVKTGATNPSIDVDYFPNTVASYYWSSSPHAFHSNFAWLLNFNDGYDFTNFKEGVYYVRLVRDIPKYTKIDNSGAAQPDNAAQWSCVKDNDTGLIWEVKTDDGGLRDKDNGYTWYDPNPATNGGDAGIENGENDTDSFVTAVNTASLCGATDWRMPTLDELRTLVKPGAFNPSIDVDYFPNTVAFFYWSSLPNAVNSLFAWIIYFNIGLVSTVDKSGDVHVRLVRSGQ